MRKLVGWLCLVSFLATMVFVACYAYAVLAPFYRGGELRVLYPLEDYYNSEGHGWSFLRSLAANKLDRSDAALLRGFVSGYVRSGNVRRSDETLSQIVDTWNTPTFGSLSDSRIAWAAVADSSGKVVAYFPESIYGGFGQVRAPNGEGWRGALPAGPLAPLAKVELIKDAQGRTIGSAAFGSMGAYREFAVIPSWAELQVPPSFAAWAAAISLVIFIISLPFWVAMDADWRGMRGGAWAVLVVVTGLIGFAAYLIARLAPPKVCPNCGEMVHSGYKRCPACGVTLLARCPKCGRKLRPGWQFCPRCTEEWKQETPEPENVQQPEETEPKPPEPEPVTIRPQSVAEATQLPTEAVQVEPALPALSHSTLTVTVRDASTGAPVAEASVTISGPTSREGRTGAAGTFEAKSLVTGPYDVSAIAKGYRAAQASVKLEPDASTPLQLAIQPLAGAIDGRVLDRAALQPVADAEVFIDSARLDRSTRTDAEGFFVLADIPPGPFTVCAKADGCLTQTRLAEVAPGQRVTLGFALEATLAEEEETTDAVQ